MGTHNSHSRACLKLFIMTLFIWVVSFFTYFSIFTYSFTAADTIALIDTNRIQSPEKIIKIFITPLMSGTSFTDRGLFYRPISSLTYALDYSLWGLDPFGYHLTDLILHMLVCAFMFYMLLVLTRGRFAVSGVSAIIFAIHPILVENIPAIARRQDTLGALFLLISLLLFLRSEQKNRSGLISVFSLIFYILALGSKETTIMLPALLFVYLFLSSLSKEDGKSLGSITIQSIKICLPYFFLALVYIVWRAYVLSGMGGYTRVNGGLSTVALFSIDIVNNFFSSLIFPASIKTFVTKSLLMFYILCSLIFVGRYFTLYRETMINFWRHSGNPFLGLLRRSSAIVLSISAIAILSYPFYVPLLDGIIERSYNGKGISILTEIMNGRSSNPLLYYQSLVQNLVLFGVLSLLVLSLAGLLFSSISKQSILSLASHSEIFRIVIFLITWLLLPLSVLLITSTFQFWNMYIPAIPFSALISIALIEPIQYIKNSGSEKNVHSGQIFPAIWSSFTAACLVIYLIYFSPIYNKYPEWKDSGNLAEITLGEISRLSADLTPGSIIHIRGLPEKVNSYLADTPHVKSVTYLQDYSIQSWLALTNPGSNINIVVDEYSTFEVYPDSLNFTVQRQQDGSLLVLVEPKN